LPEESIRRLESQKEAEELRKLLDDWIIQERGFKKWVN
jgi:hypothetical protein